VQVRDEFRDDFDPGRGGNPMNQVYLEGMGQWPGPHEKRRRGSDLQALGQPPQQRRREGTGRGPYSHGQQASVQPQVGTNSEQYGMPGQGRGVRQQVFGDPVEGFERLKEAGPAGEEGHNGGPAFGDFGGVPAPGQQEGLPGPPPQQPGGVRGGAEGHQPPPPPPPPPPQRQEEEQQKASQSASGGGAEVDGDVGGMEAEDA
jgi:hypothetical protein